MTLRAISSVVDACSSTAEAIECWKSAIRSMIARIPVIDSTERWVSAWIASICGRCPRWPCGLLGELLDLVGDDGEPLAGLAGPGRLDRRVEGEQVGLLGDRR